MARNTALCWEEVSTKNVVRYRGGYFFVIVVLTYPILLTPSQDLERVSPTKVP